MIAALRPALAVGQVWAYRAHTVDPLVPVQVHRIGRRKPARLLVAFLGAEWEGREEWVSPARLKVPWTNAAAFTALEARWDAVIAASPVRDTAEHWAAGTVFDTLIPADTATLGHARDAGVTRIHRLDALAQLLDLPHTDLEADPLCFRDGDALIVPWTTSLLIATTATRRDPHPILRHVDTEQATHRQHAFHGRTYPATRTSAQVHIAAEHYLDQERAPYNQPCWTLLRDWCGAPALERRDELTELRREVHRLGQITEDAITTLRRHGHTSDADRIDRTLGIAADNLNHSS